MLFMLLVSSHLTSVHYKQTRRQYVALSNIHISCEIKSGLVQKEANIGHFYLDIYVCLISSRHIASHQRLCQVGSHVGRPVYSLSKKHNNFSLLLGRLLKAFQIDFNWYRLASWINITEQWPFRTSWIIYHYDLYEDSLEDNTSLKLIYDK